MGDKFSVFLKESKAEKVNIPARDIRVDDTVTEASPNAVKSSGIWAWAKGLFTPKDPTETEADTLTDESVFQFWKGELKKITWANIKAALRTYFDTIYSTFSGSYNDLSHKPTIPSNAAQITVSDPVTPDYTPAVQDNNLQQVTNKVAGLQERLLAEINPSGVNGVEVVFSENHMRLRVEICSVGDNTGAATALRWTINDVVSEIYNTTSLNKYAFFQMTLGRHGNSSMFIDMFVANSAIHAKMQSQITSAADYATTSMLTRNGNTISNAEFATGINKINFFLSPGTFGAGSNIKIYKLP